MSPLILILFLSTVFSFGLAIWSLDFEPDFHPLPCMSDKTFHYVDLANLICISDFKTQKVSLNGTIRVLKDIEGNIEGNFTSERYHHGNWIPGEFKYYNKDVCKFIKNAAFQPLVYSFMQKLIQKTCPYKAGHIETFDMWSVSDRPITFPPQYMDMWRGYIRFYKNGKLIECVMFEGEIID